MKATPHDNEDEGIEFVPIPIDRETRERLVRFARLSGRHPTEVAGALLADVLYDDEAAHGAAN